MLQSVLICRECLTRSSTGLTSRRRHALHPNPNPNPNPDPDPTPTPNPNPNPNPYPYPYPNQAGALVESMPGGPARLGAPGGKGGWLRLRAALAEIDAPLLCR